MVEGEEEDGAIAGRSVWWTSRRCWLVQAVDTLYCTPQLLSDTGRG